MTLARLASNMRLVLTAIVSSFCSVITNYYLHPYLQYLGLILPLVALACFLVVITFISEAISFFAESKQRRTIKNAYVMPWLRYLTVKILLTLKETLNSRYSSAIRHLEDVAAMLEITEKTAYLRHFLTLPTSRFFLLRHFLRTVRTDHITSDAKALRTVASMTSLGREKDISSYIENIIRDVIDYDKLRKDVARDLGFGSVSNEILFFGVDDQKYLELVTDAKSTQDYELELWKDSVDRIRFQVILKDKELKKRAWLYTLMFGFTIEFALLTATASAVRFAIFPVSAIEIPVMVVISVVSGLSFVWYSYTIMWRTLRNCLMLKRFVNGRVIFPRFGLEATAIEVTRQGFTQKRLGKVACIDSQEISLVDFLYRCACTFLPKQSPKVRRHFVSFPNSHTVEIGPEKFYCSETKIDKYLELPDAAQGRYLTKQQFVDLSVDIVRSCESHKGNHVESESLQRLTWLYANAIRLGEFEQIEIANVGEFPSYRSSQAIHVDLPMIAAQQFPFRKIKPM